MHTFIIQDLPASIELDRKAMSTLRGGASDQAIGTSQGNGQGMASVANIGNASLMGGPAIVQSDNTFAQNAANYNTATNVDALLVFGRLGLVPLF